MSPYVYTFSASHFWCRLISMYEYAYSRYVDNMMFKSMASSLTQPSTFEVDQFGPWGTFAHPPFPPSPCQYLDYMLAEGCWSMNDKLVHLRPQSRTHESVSAQYQWTISVFLFYRYHVLPYLLVVHSRLPDATRGAVHCTFCRDEVLNQQEIQRASWWLLCGKSAFYLQRPSVSRWQRT